MNAKQTENRNYRMFFMMAFLMTSMWTPVLQAVQHKNFVFRRTSVSNDVESLKAKYPEHFGNFKSSRHLFENLRKIERRNFGRLKLDPNIIMHFIDGSIMNLAFDIRLEGVSDDANVREGIESILWNSMKIFPDLVSISESKNGLNVQFETFETFDIIGIEKLFEPQSGESSGVDSGRGLLNSFQKISEKTEISIKAVDRRNL